MYGWLIIGGVGLMVVVLVVTLFQTPWQEWRSRQDTKRKEPPSWQQGRDPFEDLK